MAKNYKIIEVKNAKSTTYLKGLSKSEADEIYDDLTRLYPDYKWQLKKHDADDEEVDESVADDLDNEADD